MKSSLSREQWLAIFESAASQQGEAGLEARWLVVQQLGLRPDDFPGIHAALEQRRWRQAKDPSAYVKTVARREVGRMRRPLDPHVLPLDVVGGNEFSHEEVMDHIAYANETSTAVRGGDGVWRPGGHGEQHDEYESLSDRLWAKLPANLKVPVELPEQFKQQIENYNALISDDHIHVKPGAMVNLEEWARLANFDHAETLVLKYRSCSVSRDRALAEQPNEAARKKLQAAWKRFDRTGKRRLRAAVNRSPQKYVPKGPFRHTI
jgi:hypothetical protein